MSSAIAAPATPAVAPKVAAPTAAPATMATPISNTQAPKPVARIPSTSTQSLGAGPNPAVHTPILAVKPTLPLSTQSTAGALKLGAKAPLPSAKPNTPSTFPTSATPTPATAMSKAPPAATPAAVPVKKKWYEKLGQSVDKLNSALDSIEQVSTRIDAAVNGKPVPPKTPAAVPAKPSPPVAPPTGTANVASPPLISQTPRIASSATLPASQVKTVLASRPATTPQASLRTSPIVPPTNGAEPRTILTGTATGAVSTQTQAQQLPKGAPGLVPAHLSPASTPTRTAITTGTPNPLGQRSTPAPGVPLVRPTAPVSVPLNRSPASTQANTTHPTPPASTPPARDLHTALPSAAHFPSAPPPHYQAPPPAQGHYAPPQQEQYNNDASQDQSDGGNDGMLAGAAGGVILGGGGGALAYDQYEDNQPDDDDNSGTPDAQDPQAPEDPVQPEEGDEETIEDYNPETDMPVDGGEDETGGQITDQEQGGDVTEEEPPYATEGDGYGQGDDGQGDDGQVDDGQVDDGQFGNGLGDDGQVDDGQGDNGADDTGGQVLDQGQDGGVPEEEPQYLDEGDGYGQDDDG